MTYDAFDVSNQSGAPVELFEFVMGAQTWRYTSRATDYDWGGHTWTAEAIGRGEIEQNHEINQAGIQVSFPRSNTFAAQFMTGLAEQVCTLTIRRGFEGDPDAEFVAYWKGRVAGSTADGAQIDLNCESIFTSLRRPGLRARYQKTCRHTLYQRGCLVNKAAYAATGVVLAAGGVTLTVPIAAAQPDGWYTGGMVEAPDGSLRFIMRHAGQVLTMSRLNAALNVLVAENGYGKNYGGYYGGVAVTLYPGCDHTITACNAKFSNLPNFGGFPYIPGKNPLGGASIV